MVSYPGQRRRAVLGLMSVAVFLGATVSGSAGAQDGEPEVVDGNPTCSDVGFANGFKVEAAGELVEPGTYTVGDPGTEAQGDAEGFSVTISYASTDPVDLGFEASIPVAAVLVKAGPGAYLYSYDPPVVSASGLGSPTEDSVSHITFCWNGEPPDGTTTTTTTSTTTTTVPDGKPPAQTTTTTAPAQPGPGQVPPSRVPDTSGPAQPATPITERPSFTG